MKLFAATLLALVALAAARGRSSVIECPAVGSDDLAVQVPNPDDCSSFYKCDENGRPFLHECPPGLEYNAELEVCDWPANAGCSIPKAILKSGDIVCPAPGSDDLAVHLPNPDDCSSFYKCDEDGNAHLHVCPPGLEWNAELEVCDWAASAGCSVRKTLH